MKKISKGFTVLELLVVIGIMTILLALVLVGLTRTRSQSRDEAAISKLKVAALAIEQYHDICRGYPASMDPGDIANQCSALGAGTNIDAIFPDIAAYHFNEPGSNFHYVSLGVNDADVPECTGYHLWVMLENRQAGRAEFDSKNGAVLCSANPFNSANTVDATADSHVFDIKK